MLYCVKVDKGDLPDIWSTGNRITAENFWYRFAQQVKSIALETIVLYNFF
jgi:hypothetical protein